MLNAMVKSRGCDGSNPDSTAYSHPCCCSDGLIFVRNGNPESFHFRPTMRIWLKFPFPPLFLCKFSRDPIVLCFNQKLPVSFGELSNQTGEEATNKR